MVLNRINKVHNSLKNIAQTMAEQAQTMDHCNMSGIGQAS